jgi:hypothetical protein
MKRYLPIAIALSLLAGQAVAEGLIGGGGGGDWLDAPVRTFVGVIGFGLVEAGVVYYAATALWHNHHSTGGMIAAAIAAVALLKYQTVAGWFSSGLGALGVGGL